MVTGHLHIEYKIEWAPEISMFRCEVAVTGDTGVGSNHPITAVYRARHEGEALSWAIGWAMDRVSVKDAR